MRLLAGAVLATALVSGASVSRAAPITYAATLAGGTESSSTATGSVDAVIDTTANTFMLTATFSGLEGPTVEAHVHCCTALPGTGTAGVATMPPAFTGFPLGVKSGSYTSPLFDLTSASFYNPPFLALNGGSTAAAEATFAAGLAADKAYFNLHSTVFPEGEIFGFLTPVAAPEPAGVAALAAGLLGVAAVRRRNRG